MTLGIGDHTVTGTLSGVEPKTNGWFRFSILQPGAQYPEKVDTKKQEIINQGTALLGQMVTAQVAVQDSGNENPNRPGTNYMNRYLNAIGPAAQGAVTQQAQQQTVQQAQPQQAQPGGHSGSQFDPVRVARTSGSERAIEMVEAGIEQADDIVTLVALAETWAAYILLGPERFGVTPYNSPQGVQILQAPQGAAQPAAMEQQSFVVQDDSNRPPPADDDIPF